MTSFATTVKAEKNAEIEITDTKICKVLQLQKSMQERKHVFTTMKNLLTSFLTLQ